MMARSRGILRRLAAVSSVACLVGQALSAWTPPASYAVTASPDGHFFQTSDGKPFFWLADTAWLFFHRLNHSEADVYLSDRASKGYTVIQAVGFVQTGITSPNRNGDLMFINSDVTKPNEPYWAYIDSLVELAWSKGIRIAMVPCWGQYIHGSTNTGSVINTTTAGPFGQFIGQRYPYLPKILVADTNPFWTNKTAVKLDYAAGGVAPNYTFTHWDPVYDALANGIVSGERATTNRSCWNPLMTIHPTNQWFADTPPAVASNFFMDRQWLTYDASQSGHADFPPNPPIPWWNARRAWETIELMYSHGEKAPGKKRPCVDQEPHYENRYDNANPAYPVWNASDVRVGSWQSAFSGAAGVTYGNNNVMQMYVPGVYTQDGTGPAVSWAEDIKIAGAGQMQYIVKAILDRGNASYFTRIPAQDIIVGAAGSDDKRVTATRDSKGSYIMVYTPTGSVFSIQTSSLTVTSVKSTWMNPLNGEETAFDYSTASASGTVLTFTPPTASDHKDWLLILESA